ncbi:MAG TPA: nicotinate phosphoribosyltransferase [Candidatus Binatia bacterium]|nr:nicotinate phosphoribosyltransferase [Candidatus Binatia bacterium]
MLNNVQQPGLMTDLYELTMAAAYFQNRHRGEATFELFIRNLPAHRGYLVAAGLQQALEYLENLSFSPEQIQFLRRHPAFANVDDAFFAWLDGLRFGGEVWAVAEGTPVFPMEPLLRVTAPIIEAQIVETFLLATITFQTTIASKAARVVQSAAGRPVVEFGSRRAHGPQAGVLAARAAYIGGCAGTSNVEAHFCFGVPSLGTMAHSFVMAYDDELPSFRDFMAIFPAHSVLLLDTYNSLRALDRLTAAGLRPYGVRLDSGNLVELSRQVRERLDRAGLASAIVIASGDLDEYAIAELLASGARIDEFGVGSALATSNDAPALGGVYKLVAYDREPRVKLSEKGEKPTYPGCKQVFRFAEAGCYTRDLIGIAEENYPGSEQLLSCVMRNGRRLGPAPAIHDIRVNAAKLIGRLPIAVRDLNRPAPFPVDSSARLMELFTRVKNLRVPG